MKHLVKAIEILSIKYPPKDEMKSFLLKSLKGEFQKGWGEEREGDFYDKWEQVMDKYDVEKLFLDVASEADIKKLYKIAVEFDEYVKSHPDETFPEDED
jgi:hypothetical protein